MSSIKNIPMQERPYEKLLMHGEKSLTNSELLSIIIKTGTKEETALQLAQKVLMLNNENNNLRFLSEISMKELTKIKTVNTFY